MKLYFIRANTQSRKIYYQIAFGYGCLLQKQPKCHKITGWVGRDLERPSGPTFCGEREPQNYLAPCPVHFPALQVRLSGLQIFTTTDSMSGQHVVGWISHKEAPCFFKMCCLKDISFIIFILKYLHCHWINFTFWKLKVKSNSSVRLNSAVTGTK